MRNKDTILLENAYERLSWDQIQKMYNHICEKLGGFDHVEQCLRTASKFYSELRHSGLSKNRKNLYDLELTLNHDASDIAENNPEYTTSQKELRKRREEEGELPNYGLSHD